MILDTMMLGMLSVTAAALPGWEDDRWFDGSCDGRIMSFGSDVTPDSALQTTAVNACIGKRSRSLAGLPFHIYAKGGPAWPGSKRQKRVRVPDDPLERILGKQPNDWQTAFEFREMMEGHVCTRGNAYAVIVPGKSGAVERLIPKHPDRMQVFRVENDRLGYLYRKPDGTLQRYTQDEIFHLRGQTLDGIVGVSPVTLHRRAIELAQNAEDHGVKYFKAGKPSGALVMPPDGGTLDDEAYRRLKKSWREAHSGEDLFSVAIFEDGLEWQEIGFSLDDAQYLDSRQFQVVEICRIFDVPPIMIFSEDQQDNTYSNVESKDLWYVKHCLQARVSSWEQSIWRDLIVDQDTQYGKLVLEGLLRGDTKTRGEWYDRMVGLSVYCPNDVLELEDRNPYPDGEKYYVSSLLIPADQAGKVEAETGAAVVKPAKAAAVEMSEAVVMAEGAGPIVEAVAMSPSGEPTTQVDCVAAQESDDTARRAWAEDIAGRLAAAELRELADHVDKAAEDRDRFNAWAIERWEGKQRSYVIRTISSYLGFSYLIASAADRITATAVAALTTGDPDEVYETWKTERAGELAGILGEA